MPATYVRSHLKQVVRRVGGWRDGEVGFIVYWVGVDKLSISFCCGGGDGKSSTSNLKSCHLELRLQNWVSQFPIRLYILYSRRSAENFQGERRFQISNSFHGQSICGFWMYTICCNEGLSIVAAYITNIAYQPGGGRRVHKLSAWICKKTDIVCTITFLGPEVLLGTNSQAFLKYMNE